ncbi:PREDICTED: uncharacterized protein LOC105149633 [Acromyrmex echinatior]|uniref:Uncharacterized protein n=1 Tax=Acromyrmex echinatior TaxID=103372 RepID=F4WV68_ACREC|nr:PREDICTED: uncharacterized protein LOC105149633 [Acromyrmex echinatior]EGI61956.1 hypothetical protein G5I_09859 [Acromyrmex echinatior]
MLETSRRSAISTSELGLYSDRGDRYNRSHYGLIVRKLAIGVMVVVTVILVAIFMYDFTSATTGNSKINQETKHIYILQNALKKSPSLSKKPINSTNLYEAIVNRSDLLMEDRSDDENYENLIQRNTTGDIIPPETRIMTANGPEMRTQNLHNFKQRKRVLKSIEDANENEESESKQLFDNHAIVYRVRQRYKHPDMDEIVSTEELARPTPFHWEFKTPHPTSFKRPRYPQLTQYRYPYVSRSIQDIIKYLTNNAEMPNRGIKFTGVYMNPKKYDLIPDMEEMMSNSDKSEEIETPPSYPVYNNDPFYQYKPKHPADVNLLATSNVRFSPTGVHRYSPYYDPVYSRPLITYNKPIITEPQYETTGSYSTNTLKNRKPKPFSVMLDIYPITDLVEQNKKTSWTRPQSSIDDYDLRRPLRGPKFYASSPQSIPLLGGPSPTPISEEEERKQMIFHLNLYPRRKNKIDRNDIIHKSESMKLEERQEFAKKIMSPLESITKHLTDHSTVEESKFIENKNSDITSFPISRYHEMSLDEKNERDEDLVPNNNSEIYSDLVNNDGIIEDSIVPFNHKLSIDEDYVSTENYEINAQKLIGTTEKDCANCNNATMIGRPKANTNKSVNLLKDIDIV